MVVGRKWVLQRHIDGMPTKGHFEIVSEELGDLEEGDILFETLFVSVDPYQRAFMWTMKPPYKMFGYQVRKQKILRLKVHEKSDVMNKFKPAKSHIVRGVTLQHLGIGTLMLCYEPLFN